MDLVQPLLEGVARSQASANGAMEAPLVAEDDPARR
jgi:hypothetical protein